MDEAMDATQTEHVGFFLTPDFSMISFAAVVDPLQSLLSAQAPVREYRTRDIVVALRAAECTQVGARHQHTPFAGHHQTGHQRQPRRLTAA